QLKPLKKQKEKADVYQNLTGQLKNVEVEFLSKKTQLYSLELTAFNDEKTQLSSLQTETETEMALIESQIKELKLNNKEQNEELFSLQETKSKLEQSLVVIEKQIENLEERN